VKFTYCS